MLLLDDDYKVAIYATLTRSITSATHRERLTLGDTSRDVYLDNLLAALRTLTTTLIASILDYATRTLTLGTYALRLHTSEERVLHRDDIARAAAPATRSIRR